MPQILDATDIELRNVKAWRRKLGLGDATTTLFERIETIVAAGDGNLSTAVERLAAFAGFEESGYVVQTTTTPPTFRGRQIRGRDNQINVTHGTGINGDTLLQTPQDIHSGAIPMFLSIRPTLLTPEMVTYVDADGMLASTTVTAAQIASVVTTDVLTTQGDLLTRDAYTHVRLPIGAANTVLRTDGVDPIWGKVVLTTDVTGILPVANGGTNVAAWTAGSVIFAGAGGTSLAQDNANLFYDDALNRLGVGTNAPGAFVHIDSSTADAAMFQVSRASVLKGLRITNYNGADVAFKLQRSTDLVAWTTMMAFDPNVGDVGVGVENPLARFHVAINDAVTTVTDVLRLNHSLSTGGTAANFGTGILLTGETSTTDAQDMARIQTIWTDSTHATRTSSLQFQTVNSAAALGTRMTITGAGNVGINTTGPTGLLHVGSSTSTANQNLYIDAALAFNSSLVLASAGIAEWLIYRPATTTDFRIFEIGASDRFVIQAATGRVGIANTAPGALLDLGLAGTTAGVMRLAGATSGNITINTNVNAGTWTLTLPVNDGAANEFLQTDGAGITSWSSVDLTTDVTGILPIANGGTNANAFGTSEGVVYFDGTRLVNSADLLYSGSELISRGVSLNGVNEPYAARNINTGAGAGTGYEAELADTSNNLITAGYLTWTKEQSWTTTVTTQDSMADIATTLNGVTTSALNLRSSGSVVCGKDSTDPARTDDFLYLCTVSAAPSTAPITEFGSRAAITYNTNTKEIEVYDPTDDTWRSVAVT